MKELEELPVVTVAVIGSGEPVSLLAECLRRSGSSHQYCRRRNDSDHFRLWDGVVTRRKEKVAYKVDRYPDNEKLKNCLGADLVILFDAQQTRPHSLRLGQSNILVLGRGATRSRSRRPPMARPSIIEFVAAEATAAIFRLGVMKQINQ